MIKLAFITGAKKIIKFSIDGKTIKYYDDLWREGIQIMPKDDRLIKNLIRSGKPSLKLQAALILDANKGKDLEEYNRCNTEEELAEMIRNDCKSKGIMEAK